MVNLPAARRPHRSRIRYAFGLLALVGAATALVVVARHPALSSTRELTEPVPAPEITVVGEGSAPPTEPDEPGWGGVPDVDSLDEDDTAPAGTAPTPGGAGAGAGQGALAGAPADSTGVRMNDVSRSLFYSGLLGLTISLAGLGLVGTRRRQW